MAGNAFGLVISISASVNPTFFAPIGYSNWPSITHLASCLSRYQPTISSDESGRYGVWLFPGAQQAAQQEQLSQVVRIVVGDEQGFAEHCLAVAVWQRGKEIC